MFGRSVLPADWGIQVCESSRNVTFVTIKARGRAGWGLGHRSSALQPAGSAMQGERPLKSQTTNKIAAGTRSSQGSRREILHH